MTQLTDYKYTFKNFYSLHHKHFSPHLIKLTCCGKGRKYTVYFFHDDFYLSKEYIMTLTFSQMIHFKIFQNWKSC